MTQVSLKSTALGALICVALLYVYTTIEAQSHFASARTKGEAAPYCPSDWQECRNHYNLNHTGAISATEHDNDTATAAVAEAEAANMVEHTAPNRNPEMLGALDPIAKLQARVLDLERENAWLKVVKKDNAKKLLAKDAEIARRGNATSAVAVDTGLADNPRKGEASCCTFEYVRDRMDLAQRGVCGKEYTMLKLSSHGWGVDLMQKLGDRVLSQLFNGSDSGTSYWMVTQKSHASCKAAKDSPVATPLATPLDSTRAPCSCRAGRMGCWHYAKGVCPKQNLECYFKKTMNDRPPDPNREGCLEKLPPHTPNCCNKSNYASRLKYFGYEYLTQPLQKYKELATKRAEKLRMPSDTTPCGVIHVRRADALLNRGWDGAGPLIYRNVSLAEYIDHAKEYLEKRGASHLILMTDDAMAIEETAAFKEYTWHWLDRKRFAGSEGGWENHFPSGSRETEVVNIMALIYATRQCRVLVASRSSFALMHFHGMEVYQKDPWYVYVETRNGITTAQGAPGYAINKGKAAPNAHKWPVNTT